MHTRLREALAVTRDALRQGVDADVALDRDLLLLCRGFCSALTGHHEGEDRHLFPAIERTHPELAGTVQQLMQDHSMMAHLIGALQRAISDDRPAQELNAHLEGLEAIMESHFRFEERRLLSVLDALALDEPVSRVFGAL